MIKNTILNAIRLIERDMNYCPAIDCDDLSRYPYVDEEQIAMMESEYSNDTSFLYVYPYVRDTEDPFIDVYIWDCTLLSRPWKRFVIKNGYRFEKETENLFIENLRSSSIHISDDSLNMLYNHVREIFPDYNYKKYETSEAGMAILHLYYASHHSGHQEILYKAGLSRLAYNSFSIPDCNYLGSSPEEIIGLPLKLLKILNQPLFECFYLDRESFEGVRLVYKKYSGYFNNPPSFSQFYYLYRIVTKDTSNKLFNKTVYKRLENRSDKHIVNLYIEFLRLCEKANIKITIPQSYEELLFINEELWILDNDRYNKRIEKKIKNRKNDTNYDFVGHEFSVFMPADIKEMGKEALEQNNCLIEYIEPHSKKLTTILFLRRTRTSQKPFVTIEITNNTIEQIQGRNNTLPDPDVFLFMEKYCAYKAIEYFPLALIIEAANDNGNQISDELYAYMQFYLDRRRKCGIEEIKRTPVETEPDETDGQMTLYDIFPECMITDEDKDENDNDDNSFYALFEGNTYKPCSDLDSFIWKNIDVLFNVENEEYISSHDIILNMIKSLDVNEQSFNNLWRIFEAYNIPEVKYALLNKYGDLLTKNEVDMIKASFSTKAYDDMTKRWNKSNA